MKLRFRGNSLRLRVNRREVEALASGGRLEERVSFPDASGFRYSLEPVEQPGAVASFRKNAISIGAPGQEVRRWAADDSVGLYYDLPTVGEPLRIIIEKDLECIDGPPDERDPDAFARISPKAC
jgi:hypothetical protein